MQRALKGSTHARTCNQKFPAPVVLAAKRGFLLTGLSALASMGISAQSHSAAVSTPAQLTIDPTEIVTPVSPMLYGMMTEEINHAFDGGLYAELIRNRTFRASWEGVQHWTPARRWRFESFHGSDRSSGPSKALPYSVKLRGILSLSPPPGWRGWIEQRWLLGNRTEAPYCVPRFVLRQAWRLWYRSSRRAID